MRFHDSGYAVRTPAATMIMWILASVVSFVALFALLAWMLGDL
jgi:hypothetical protein